MKLNQYGMARRVVASRERAAEARGAAVLESKDHSILDVAARADRIGARVLMGGGRVFAVHGLISPHVSTAAHMVVDPPSIGELVADLRIGGWVVEAPRQRFTLLPTALVTLSHPDRVNLINMQSIIPGYFEGPERTFDVLWERRSRMSLRGQRSPCSTSSRGVQGAPGEPGHRSGGRKRPAGGLRALSARG